MEANRPMKRKTIYKAIGGLLLAIFLLVMAVPVLQAYAAYENTYKNVKVAINVAHFHHEKWNGKGYPTGKKETEIPVEARIMALADVFDALVSKRCYKEAFSYDEAFNIVKESLGEHFDPELGELFLTCRDDLEAFYNEMIVS